MRLVLSPEARADLRDIFLYIAGDNPAAARAVLKRIRHRNRYRRIVGKVLDSGQDLNLALVRDGMCCWYRRYADEQSPRDQRLHREAAETARAGRRGLWRHKNPVPPWEWRHR